MRKVYQRIIFTNNTNRNKIQRIFNYLFRKNTFVVERLIGTGGSGMVYSGYGVYDNKPVAIKIAVRNNWTTVPNEIMYMKRLRRVKQVMKLVQYDVKDRPKYTMVMKRWPNSEDLYCYINRGCTIDETETKRLFVQILDIVSILRKFKVFHRDLKDENFMVNLDDKKLFVIDFGSATEWIDEHEYTEFEGTRLYCPPEWILNGRYRAESATVWSLGIMLYAMLVGNIPFHCKSDIIRRRIYYPSRLSIDARRIIDDCLTLDPSSRISLKNLVAHEWLK